MRNGGDVKCIVKVTSGLWTNTVELCKARESGETGVGLNLERFSDLTGGEILSHDSNDSWSEAMERRRVVWGGEGERDAIEGGGAEGVRSSADVSGSGIAAGLL